MKKIIGIIAEAQSDFEPLVEIIKNVTQSNYTYKKRLGNGCGKIINKCAAWTYSLEMEGCNIIIILHDADFNSPKIIEEKLKKQLSKFNLNNKLICIPVQEIESWFLSDPDNLKVTFKLKKPPKIKSKPELINSPKEYLEEIIYFHSEKRRYYNNVKDNKILSQRIDIDKIRRLCPSFAVLHDFILSNLKSS